MAHLAVVKAVEARLREHWSHSTIRVENDEDGLDENGGPVLAMQFPWSRSEWQTVEGPDGSDFLEEGAFRFVLSIRRGSGTDVARGWLDDLAGAFRGTQFDGVQTFAPSSPVTDDRNDVAGLYRLSFSVPYEFLIQHKEA
ncbi:hypothetical protein [Aureimonas mangrovi]|uniref:hypothetical protein n=1 Tax=Aureimonas mangrovi TaxID=2758041 RepID=UPI00163D9D83|nr:hypothetical protein [Aureimonas mangrovi]